MQRYGQGGEEPPSCWAQVRNINHWRNCEGPPFSAVIGSGCCSDQWVTVHTMVSQRHVAAAS